MTDPDTTDELSPLTNPEMVLVKAVNADPSNGFDLLSALTVSCTLPIVSDPLAGLNV